MIRLVALNRRPDDVRGILNHYHDVHMPLAKKMPHLIKAEVSEGTGSPMAEPPFFYVAQSGFPDKARFDEAKRWPENRPAGKDLMSFARDLVTLTVVGEVKGDPQP